MFFAKESSRILFMMLFPLYFFGKMNKLLFQKFYASFTFLFFYFNVPIPDKVKKLS